MAFFIVVQNTILNTVNFGRLNIFGCQLFDRFGTIGVICIANFHVDRLGCMYFWNPSIFYGPYIHSPSRARHFSCEGRPLRVVLKGCINFSSFLFPNGSIVIVRSFRMEIMENVMKREHIMFQKNARLYLLNFANQIIH